MRLLRFGGPLLPLEIFGAICVFSHTIEVDFFYVGHYNNFSGAFVNARCNILLIRTGVAPWDAQERVKEENRVSEQYARQQEIWKQSRRRQRYCGEATGRKVRRNNLPGGEGFPPGSDYPQLSRSSQTCKTRRVLFSHVIFNYSLGRVSEELLYMTAYVICSQTRN